MSEKKEKKCNRCLETKPLEDFYKRNKGSGVYPYTICKKCWVKRCEESRKNFGHYSSTKRKARDKVRSAVYQGKIKRLPCEKCGDPNSEAHHEDYSKPLEVVFLCKKHHNELHRSKTSNVITTQALKGERELDEIQISRDDGSFKICELSNKYLRRKLKSHLRQSNINLLEAMLEAVGEDKERNKDLENDPFHPVNSYRVGYNTAKSEIRATLTQALQELKENQDE